MYPLCALHRALSAQRVVDGAVDGIGSARMRVMERIRESSVGRSIWRAPDRVTERDRAAGHWSSFLLHIYPVKMSRR